MKINTRLLKRLIERLLTCLRLQDRHLSLLLTDNKGITRLNKKYFNKDKPTNVISFSYLNTDIPAPDGVIGDIAISVEMADIEAKISNKNFQERLVELIIHGLVHVMGFDHEIGEREAQKMRYREKKLLKYICGEKIYTEFISQGKLAGYNEEQGKKYKS